MEQAGKIAQFVREHPDTIYHQVYYSADELLSDYAAGQWYDLIFLDIQMPGTTGFEAAQIIREKYFEKTPLITFVTSAQNYAPEGYGIAWRFLVKPVDIEMIHRLINLAVSELKRHTLLIETTSGMTKIAVKNIIFIEAISGFCEIHTDQATYKTRAALKSVAEMLPENLYTQTHRSFYVNLSHVISYKGSVIVMAGGAKVPIGKNRKAEFIQALTRYLRGDGH